MKTVLRVIFGLGFIAMVAAMIGLSAGLSPTIGFALLGGGFLLAMTSNLVGRVWEGVKGEKVFDNGDDTTWIA